MLKNHDSTVVKEDEIALFLEIPIGDVFSDNILLIKAGNNAKKYVKDLLGSDWANQKYTLDETQIKGLLASLESGESLWAAVVGIIFKIQGYIADKIASLNDIVLSAIADFFGDTIRIDEKRWNINSAAYNIKDAETDIIGFLKQKSQSIDVFLKDNAKILPNWVFKIIKTFKSIADAVISGFEEAFKTVENLWAFACGYWNGLMDLISCIFELIKLLLEGLHSATDAGKEFYLKQDYYTALAFEYLDNILQAVLKIDWKKVFIKILGYALKFIVFLLLKLPQKLRNKISNVNHSEVYYYLGYLIFNCIEFIIPPLKLAKLGKVLKLEKVVLFFDEILLKVLKLTKTVKIQAVKLTELFFQVIEDAIKSLKAGTEAFLKIIDDVVQAIKKWLEEAFGVETTKLMENFTFISEKAIPLAAALDKAAAEIKRIEAIFQYNPYEYIAAFTKEGKML